MAIIIPRKSGTRAPTLAPQVIMGINHAHSFSKGIYDSWRVGEVTQRVSDGTTQGYTEGSGMSRYASRVGVGTKRGGANNGNGYIDIETRDSGTLTHNGGYTVVALMDAVASSLNQSIVDDDGAAVRTLQFRVSTAEKVEAIVWRTSGALDVGFTTAATLTEGIHVVALRVIDSGEVSLWVDGVKDAAPAPMLGSARPLFTNGKLRLFNRKKSTYNPSSSAMFGVHVYQEPIADSALKGMGTPEGFWSVYNQGTRRIFLSAGGGATPRSVTLRQGSIHLTGQNSSASLARTMTLQQGLIHLIGQSAGATLARTMTLQQGLIHLIGQSPSVGLARDMTLQQALIHLTGQNVGISTGERSVTLQQALIHITGQDLGVTLSRDMTLQQGLIHLTGQDTEVAFSTFLAAWARLSNRTINIGTRSRIT